MKNAIITIFLSLFVIGGIIFYVSHPDFVLNFQEIAMILVLLVVLGFALYLAQLRIRAVRKKLPAEDEYSKKLMKKAASTSYFISLYLWLAIMYLSDKVVMETHTLIGTGILAMALVFALSWLFFNIRGMGDE
jgi:peptidoglycan/LPS O-acetylase OafA/YrhL